MPARSKSQQRLFGMVHAYQKGKLKNAPEEVRNIARSISDEDAEHFAKTKHKGLPEKKAYQNSQRRLGMIHKEAYERGFMDKCAEMGVDLSALTKEASTLPAWLVNGLEAARKTGRQAREIFTPEQMQLAGRMSRRAVRGFSKRRSAAADDVASFLRNNFPVLGKGTQLTPEGAIRQYEIIAKAHTLPSMVKFDASRHLRDVLESISQGGNIRLFGNKKLLSSIGWRGSSSSAGRRVKGAVRSVRHQIFSASPAKRRKMLENYQTWLGAPQPNSAEDVANIANMVADTVRKMK